MAIHTEQAMTLYHGWGTSPSDSKKYPISFPFLDASHVKAGLMVDDELVPLEEGTYSVLAGDESEPPAVEMEEGYAESVQVVIYRQVPLTQPTVYPQTGVFQPEEHEKALDRLTMLIQQVARAVDGNGIYSTGSNNVQQDTFAWETPLQRGSIKPQRRGQVGVQLSTGSVWMSRSSNVGDWEELARGSDGPPGPDGPPGANGTTGLTGPAGDKGNKGDDGPTGAEGPPLKPRGTWTNANHYKAGDLVSHAGASYAALVDHSNKQPDTHETEWMLMSAKGETGPTGPTGPNGPNGPQGIKGDPGHPDGTPGIPGTPGTPGTPGEDGMPGEDGTPGTDGVDGTPGTDGVDGTPGTDGMPGSDGNPGTDGIPGTPGTDGIPGTNGSPGDAGLPGSPGKEAIVPTSSGPRALFCMEAPDVWFFDMVHVPWNKDHELRLDPLFVEVCEPGSIIAVSACADYTARVGARVEKEDLLIVERDSQVSVTVMLAGIRKGSAGQRFAKRTEEQMRLNTERWSHLSAAASTLKQPQPTLVP